MNRDAVLHKGLLTDCKVCNPPTETQEKRERRKRRGPLTLDMVVRRQVASDLGEEEPKKDERFQLLQKYGVAAPRIDRLVTRPTWKPIAEFRRQLNDFYKATKGLVVPTQRRQYASKTQHGSVQHPRMQWTPRKQQHVSPSLQERMATKSSDRLGEKSSSPNPIRHNNPREARTSTTARREVFNLSHPNRKIGDRP